MHQSTTLNNTYPHACDDDAAPQSFFVLYSLDGDVQRLIGFRR